MAQNFQRLPSAPGSFYGSTQPPRCRAYIAAAQTLNGSGSQKILLDSTTYDSAGMFDSTNHRIYIRVPGFYTVLFNLSTGTAITGRLFPSVYKNGSEIIRGMEAALEASGANSRPGGDVPELAVGDYLELYAYQNTGTDSVFVNIPAITFLTVHYLST